MRSKEISDMVFEFGVNQPKEKKIYIFLCHPTEVSQTCHGAVSLLIITIFVFKKQ